MPTRAPPRVQFSSPIPRPPSTQTMRDSPIGFAWPTLSSQPEESEESVEEFKQELDPFEDVEQGDLVQTIEGYSVSDYIRVMKADERPIIQELLGRIPKSYKYDGNKGRIDKTKWIERVNKELAKIQRGRGIRRKVK